MSAITSIIFALSLLATGTTAFAFVPCATPTIEALIAPVAGPNGAVPHPTLGPSVDELRKRQSLFTQGLVIAPDSICGWLSGSSALTNRFACNPSQTCLFDTRASTLGCYDPTSSEVFTFPTGGCANSASLASCSTAGSCVNVNSIYCTSSIYPFCNTGFFANVGVYVTYCGKTLYSTNDGYETTYIGEKGVSFSTVGVAAATTTSSALSSSAAASSTTVKPPSSSTTTSPASSTVPPTPPAKSHTGAIVGGAVGGVAAIALVFTAIFFILRRRRPSTHTSPNEQTPPAFSPNPATGGYDPYGAGAGAAGTIPVEKTPQQQGYGYQPVSPQPGEYSQPGQYAQPQYAQPQYAQPHQGQYLQGGPDPQSARPYSEITEVSSPSVPYEPYKPYVDPSAPGAGGQVYHEKA